MQQYVVEKTGDSVPVLRIYVNNRKTSAFITPKEKPVFITALIWNEYLIATNEFLQQPF